MPFWKLIILAIVQGLAELLPVSSSAHVVVAEKLLHLDPSAPDMTLLLVMLHTGTMFAVIVYFWRQWKRAYFSSSDAFKRFAIRAIWASALTALIGYPIMKLIEHALNGPDANTVGGAAGKYVTACVVGHQDIEAIFSRLDFVAPALFAAGLLILFAGLKGRSTEAPAASAYDRNASRGGDNLTFGQAGWMGAVQGLCLPFRGFSRSGATISTGLLANATRERAERFSFALAVILTPPAVLREVNRLLRAAQCDGGTANLHSSATAALLGMVLSFLAGLAALRWLSSWLESGKWYLFGIYCIIASCVVFYLHHIGY
jgi:undecaprenyl-diphosphatase